MDYYENAQETERAAEALYDAEIYRQSVYMSCLAVELYLKSKLYLVSYEDGLERSHDVVNIYRALISRYKPKFKKVNMIVKCRKFYNESRYPYTNEINIYTKEFAKGFIIFIKDIKDYVENECVATTDDLIKKYPKK